MDGAGSTQVNHDTDRKIIYRLVIELNYTVPNFKTLHIIQSQVGGRVYPYDDSVLRVVDSRPSFLRIIRFSDIYPPLTTRLRTQLSSALPRSNDGVPSLPPARSTKYSSFACIPSSFACIPFDHISYFPE